MTAVDSTFVVNFGDFDFELVADFDDFLDGFNATRRKLRNVAQSFLAERNFHERANRHDSRNGTFVNFTGRDVVNNLFDNFNRAVNAFDALARDENLSVFVNVDFDAGFFDDFVDDLAARADNFADFVNVDLIVRTRGAYGDKSGAGSLITSSILPKMKLLPRLA